MNPSWISLFGEETCQLGESPFWHPHEQCLYWVDTPACQVLRARPGDAQAERWDLPAEPCCIAPAQSGGLVLALRDGIYRARTWGGALSCLVRLDYDGTTTRCNDGKCDAQGRFWVGTLYEPRDARRAALYCIDAQGGMPPQVTLKANDAVTANGLAWSPDNRTLYWADTPSHIVHAWDFDPDRAVLRHQRTFQQFPPKPAGWQPGQHGYGGRPDGAAVDSQGNYYCAMFEGARLCRFAPDGSLLAEIATPARCPTMPCFGGDDLCTLYLTTARHQRSAQELLDLPWSGHVLAMRVDVPGLPVNFFQD
ncbi:MAG TPA: SMP-30/gluconolactonase/LRE family protein [Burkholderiaceae bacterium]